MTKRPYRLFAAHRGSWHMDFVSSYATDSKAEKAARDKIEYGKHGGLFTVTKVSVVHAETGKTIFELSN